MIMPQKNDFRKSTIFLRFENVFRQRLLSSAVLLQLPLHSTEVAKEFSWARSTTKLVVKTDSTI